MITYDLTMESTIPGTTSEDIPSGHAEVARATPTELALRGQILQFEEILRSVPGHWEGDSDRCPLTHEYPPGLYVRTIIIPAGTTCTGKLHRHPHPNILHYGRVDVVTEAGGYETLEGPLYMLSRGLTKRALYAHTELCWTTIHPNPRNLRDPAALERELIQDDLSEYTAEVAALERP